MSLIVDIKKKLSTFTLEVSLEAGAETLGLLGESGCGKSMTMRCIAGVESPDEGKIIVNGQTYFDSAAKINLSPQERRTALLFQNYQLFPHMTVEANIGAGIDKSKSADEKKRLVQAELARFALEDFAKRYPLQLSGGQQQRVALARMLAAQPGILMLDEPFSALDAHLKSVLEQNLISLFDAFDGSILYVSHDIDEAVRFCDRIAVISQGHVAEIDTPAEIVARPKSKAGLKLSGMKNVTPAVYVDTHMAHLPRWGVDVSCAGALSESVTNVGIRAFYVERADGPGANCFRMRVDRASDSRFDRTVSLSFLDFEPDERNDSAAESEMNYLKHSLKWRVDKLQVADADLPQVGDELWVRLPEDRLVFVDC